VNTVRRAVETARYDWFSVRVGGPGASMRGQWPTVLIAAVLVFGCFFAIGRVGRASAPHGEASSALRAFSRQAAIPGALNGKSPIAGSVPSEIAGRPSLAVPVQAAPANGESRTLTSVQPFADNASHTLAPSVQTQTTPAVESAPVKTSAPSAARGGSSGKPTGSGGAAHQPSSHGGSFDSSE
jgi:hypothetical protein